MNNQIPNKVSEFKSFVKNLSTKNHKTYDDKPKVTKKDFKKPDQSKFLILPKRRADTNTVYSYGLKYAFNQEKNISKDILNGEYFPIDITLMKSKIAEDEGFREKIIQRILLNKNLKKKFTCIEKPFPCISKSSNCKVTTKTENFLLSLILNHKFEIDEELLNELIKYRKNKNFGNEKDNEVVNKSEKNLQVRHSLANNLFGRTPFMENEENLNKDNISELTEGKGSNYNNEFAQDISSEKPKKDFFIVSSNFSETSKLKYRRKALKKMKQEEAEISLAQKFEDNLIKSLEYVAQKINKNFGVEKKPSDNILIKNYSVKDEENNQENNNKSIDPIGTDISNDKSNKFSNSAFQADNLLNDNLRKFKHFSKKNLKQIKFNNKEISLEKKIKKEGYKKFPSKGDSSFKKSNMDFSVIKPKKNQVKFFNFSKNNSLIKSQSNKFMNSTLKRLNNKEKITENLENYDNYNFLNFNRQLLKTLTTENDFRKINSNTIKGILDEKKNKNNENLKSESKSKKPDFMKFKFPDSHNSTDLDYEKIKLDAIKRVKSSQIKIRINNNFNSTNNINKFQKDNFNNFENDKDYLKFNNFGKTGSNFNSPLLEVHNNYKKYKNCSVSKSDKKIKNSEISKINVITSGKKEGFTNMVNQSGSKDRNQSNSKDLDRISNSNINNI